jgi:hypothetical protein
MTERDLMAGWRQLLTVIQLFDPKAHIAGGAVRDIRLGREIKDVDVFADDRDAVRIQDVMRRCDYRMISQKGSDYFEHNPEVRKVDYWQRDDELPVNIIYLATGLTVEENIARFDLGICKTGFDGHKIISSKDFANDWNQAEMTMVFCANPLQYLRTLERYDRLQAKYEAWPLVIPEQFRKFAPVPKAAWQSKQSLSASSGTSNKSTSIKSSRWRT